MDGKLEFAADGKGVTGWLIFTSEDCDRLLSQGRSRKPDNRPLSVVVDELRAVHSRLSEIADPWGDLMKERRDDYGWVAASADSTVEAGAPAKEIEITPEMIEAGSAKLKKARFDIEVFDPYDEVVEEIFLAMISHQKSPDLESQ